MSKADARRRDQRDALTGNEDERARRASNDEPPLHLATTDPMAWASVCAGWRGGFHERAAVGDDGRWRCRWCWQWLTPPPAKE
jgi:hypothetical protein